MNGIRSILSRPCPAAFALACIGLIMGVVAPRTARARDAQVVVAETGAAGDFCLARGKSVATIYRDASDFAVVQVAADALAADVERVTGAKPVVATGAPQRADSAVLIGTLGKSSLIDRLVAARKLDVRAIRAIRGKWESFVVATVPQPLPGVRSGLVIVGSDRRGTAYGVFTLSQAMGVSPWYWWSDVPARHHDSLFVRAGVYPQDSPGVKYRGIFINDEDWGLNPWASKTFDPEFGNVGPKTYAKVFELMLRLRLNCLWPAMHACSKEFGATPENAALADKYAIVAGASHCEPMLYNNVHWKPANQGPWNYATNRDAVHAAWETSAKARGADEAVWTLGIRGIHDAPMQAPPQDMPGKLSLMTDIFHDQRALLDQDASKDWGAVAQCFVPYKEVLPIYDAGLKVPDDVTLVWVDDNFGYIRRLSGPDERKRAGGAGVYWHLSYYGFPHSYTWVNTTPPALIWEELHKAWENDASRLWMLNVGDIKPMEIGIDYYARLAWNPEGFGPDAQQPTFLKAFGAENFGAEHAQAVADLLADYYRLGTIRKPELMNRAWAMKLPPETASGLESDYHHVLDEADALLAALPANQRDAFTELIGFPAHVLGEAGLIFLADRKAQRGEDAAANTAQIATLRADLETRVTDFNTRIAGGKWNRMMPGLVTGKDLTQWNSQVRWPWGERPRVSAATNPKPAEAIGAAPR